MPLLEGFAGAGFFGLGFFLGAGGLGAGAGGLGAGARATVLGAFFAGSAAGFFSGAGVGAGVGAGASAFTRSALTVATQIPSFSRQSAGPSLPRRVV